MTLFSTETKGIISKNSVTEKTYKSKVASIGFSTYVKGLGGVFARLYGNNSKIATVRDLHDRMEFVCGLMAIFRMCYWNGATWWYWLNSASKSFYSKKVTNRGCRGGTIYQLCQGDGGRLRITNCNYGVDTLLKACGIYSLKKTTVTSKAKLVPGDVVDFYRKSDGKWHHQVVVHSISGGKIWCCDFGNRFIKSGEPLHYMSATGTAAGGEYGTDTWKGRHRITLKATQEVPTMNGVDIASYQAGIDFSTTPADFVIIKATEGTGYVNPDCNRAYDNAKRNGKLIGLYHYANGGDPAKEADYFIDNIANYVGSALLALDWERAGNPTFGKNDVAWCRAWLDHVYKRTGVRPLIYMSQSVVIGHDWSGVAKEYGLWMAQYVVESRSGYKSDYQHASTGAWPYPAIWQYTSGGYLPGWNARLDLDVAYMDRDAWMRYASKAKETKTEAPKVIVPKTIKQGSTGKTVKMWQAFLGFTGDDIDGKFGAKETVPATKKWQAAHKDIEGYPLKVDGVVGPKTWASALKSIS